MTNDETILLSSILDVVYCKRRWYLHTIEQQNCSDNVFLTLGKQAHEKVDENNTFYCHNCMVYTNFRVYSEAMHLTGICDSVVFAYDENGVSIPLFAMEVKHGKVRDCNEYKAQLAAQVMCLEEMYGCVIRNSYLYYFDDNSIVNVEINDAVRKLVIDAVSYIREYDGVVISAKHGRKCKGCSMYDICNPRETNISDYISKLWGDCDV